MKNVQTGDKTYNLETFDLLLTGQWLQEASTRDRTVLFTVPGLSVAIPAAQGHVRTSVVYATFTGRATL